MGRFKLVTGTQSEYDNATKNNDTLYFTTDTQKIYKGDKNYSKGTGYLPFPMTILQTLNIEGIENHWWRIGYCNNEACLLTIANLYNTLNNQSATILFNGTYHTRSTSTITQLSGTGRITELVDKVRTVTSTDGGARFIDVYVTTPLKNQPRFYSIYGITLLSSPELVDTLPSGDGNTIQLSLINGLSTTVPINAPTLKESGTALTDKYALKAHTHSASDIPVDADTVAVSDSHKFLCADVGGPHAYSYWYNTGAKIWTWIKGHCDDVYLGKNDEAASVAWGNVTGKPALATLGSDGRIPNSQLPSYVDDVLEYNSKSEFPASGESGKIYIAKDTNLTWRWGGSSYVEISPSLALGETTQTAYSGSKGKQLRDDFNAHVTASTTAINGKADVGHTHAYLPLSGGTLSGNVGVDGVMRVGRRFENVLSCLLNKSVTAIVIKTKLPFAASACMPLIHITGYAYGRRSPIDLSITYYIYGSTPYFSENGATCLGGWGPRIFLSKYTYNGGNYVAITLRDSIYYPLFIVDVQDIWHNVTRDVGSGWTYEYTTSTDEDTINNLIPQDNIIEVSYKALITDVTGNAATASKVAWSGITSKPTTFTPAAHTHAASDITTAESTLEFSDDTRIACISMTSQNANKLWWRSGSKLWTWVKGKADNLYQPKGNYLTSFTETDPTVPAWAKAATKPSYSWSEIGSKPTIPTKTSQLTNDSGFLTSHQSLSAYMPKSGGVFTGNVRFPRRLLLRSSNTISGSVNYDSGIYIDTQGSESTVFANRASASSWAFVNTDPVSPDVGNHNTTTFNDATAFKITLSGVTAKGWMQGSGFKTPTGTSSQFLKADGSVDSTSYLSKDSAGKLNEVIHFKAESLPQVNNPNYILSIKPFADGGDVVWSPKTAFTLPWSQITNKPITYEPSTHTHSYLPLSGGTLTNLVHIQPSTLYDNFNEGLRLYDAPNHWQGIGMGDFSGTSGFESGSYSAWFLSKSSAGDFRIIQSLNSSSNKSASVHGLKLLSYSSDNSKIGVFWKDVKVIDNNNKVVMNVASDALPTATSSNLGAVRLGYTNSDKNYKLQVDSSGNAYVNVPWTDTVPVLNSQITALPVWSAAPTDNCYFIKQDTGGSNTYGRVKMSALWTYIKGKADAIYATPSQIPTAINGQDGATFTPSVSSAGVISWTNNKGLTNPTSISIKGPKGDTGNPGTNGTNGTNGVSCTHSWNGTTLSITSASGTSSANLKGATGATPTIAVAEGANIGSVGTPSVSKSTSGTTTTFTFNYLKGAKGDKGDKGDTGDTGPQGPQGIQGVQGIQGPAGPAGSSATTEITGDSATSNSITFSAGIQAYMYRAVSGNTSMNLLVNNNNVNYLAVKNSSSSEVSITISAVKLNGTSLTSSNIHLPVDGIKIQGNKLVEISVVAPKNTNMAFITCSQNLT